MLRCLCWTLLAAVPAWALPVLEVTRDDTRLTRSCRVVIPPGTVIADTNTNGVLHVAADGVTIVPGFLVMGKLTLFY